MANRDISKDVTDENVKEETTTAEESEVKTEAEKSEEQEDDMETDSEDIEIADENLEELEAADESDDAASGDEEKIDKKKGIFGKKKDKKDAQIEELTDRLKRTMAEFDNYRKRTEKEKTSMYEMGQRSIIEKILPIVDNFERGLLAVTDEEKNTPFIDGMDKVYKQLMKSLEDVGVEVIETENKEFDPNLHNAVMHVEDENLGENVIAKELQKGYTHKGTVVRHSMVSVAN